MIVLDTHAWIWAVADPKKLSRRAREVLAGEDSWLVSAISCWELAMLVARGRLQLDRDVMTWIREALADEKTDLAAISPEIAVSAAQFDGKFPGDRADRLIAATALVHAARLVTKDERLRRSAIVDVVW